MCIRDSEGALHGIRDVLGGDRGAVGVLDAVLEGEGPGEAVGGDLTEVCLLYTSPSPRDRTRSRMPSSA